MELEPITRQEQIIAGKDLEPITRMERFLKDYSVSNYFGETTVKGDTLTWDGNTEGRGTVGQFVKVSDVVLTKADFANGASVTLNDSEVITLTAEEIQAAFFEDNVFLTEFLVGIPYDGCDLGDGFVAAAGIYFLDTRLDEGNVYISSLTIPGYTGFETKTIKRLDEKYMPILTSPNGTKFRLAVNDDGTVTTAEVTE